VGQARFNTVSFLKEQHMMSRSTLPVAFILTLTMLATTVAPASAEPATQAVKLLRDRTPADRPLLMLLGAPHFANYGLDVVKSQVPDVLEPQRQKEMLAVVEALSTFKPTKVVVEWPSANQAELDAKYQAFRAGTYTLSRSETDQLALRVAAKLGHARVYAADWNKMPPGEVVDFDYEQWAESRGQQARLAEIRNPARNQKSDAFMRTTPVADWLVDFNAPEQLADSNRRYFDFAMLSDEDNYAGANWLANWYGRNLKILSNLVRLADNPGDRVLVVYGAGHIFQLRQFAEQSGAFTLVDPVPILKGTKKP
jgi:hypothetical protein